MARMAHGRGYAAATTTPRARSRERLLGGPLALRMSLALARVNAHYWPTVAPAVGGELRAWKARAKEIPDGELRTLALEKLRQEHFNAQVAATLATRAPRRQRRGAIRAIVALEVMYDYLDGLTEGLTEADGLRAGRRLYEAFADALAPAGSAYADYYGDRGRSRDGGYLRALSATVREELWRLPGAAAIVTSARETAALCGEAQLQIHCAPHQEDARLRSWAEQEALATGLGWREFLAGAAASVLSLHALLAAGTRRECTSEQAARVAETYLCICALSTMLDSLVDHEEDEAAGARSYLGHFADREELAESLTSTARLGIGLARQTREEAHHAMILTGVVSYYISAPAAKREPAAAVAAWVKRELSPAIAPALATMRAWRLAKLARARLRSGVLGAGGAGELEEEARGR